MTSQTPDIVAASQAMRDVLALATRAAESDVTVLIQGETGTGKELVAQHIHRTSLRSGGAFVAVNCGAYADSLLASELFGHVRGAFTGAVVDRAGVFEVAHGGTVFLDEIADMSAEMQVKVLRVLQEGCVMRVGSSSEIDTDVRVIAATNADLAALVSSGKFREDLYYRIKVVACDIPPLRNRRDDIPALIDHYLAKFCREAGKPDLRLSANARRRLCDGHWPGNVRQVRSEIEQIVAMAGAGQVVDVDRLSPEISVASQPADNRSGFEATEPGALFADDDATYQELLDLWTADVLEKRLARFGGNISRTAQSLSISRTTLYALLKKYGMHGTEE